MRTILQLNDLDCGIAVAAMLARRPYKAAQAADSKPDSLRGFSLAEMVACLKKLGTPSVATLIHGPKRVSLARWVASEDCALVIRSRGKRIGHWVAYEGSTGDVLDPDLGRCAAASYSRKSWLVVAVVKPESSRRM